MVRAQRRQRGAIETLPSGSLRVKVYAGYDPISGRRHYLDEVVPAGPRAGAEAERVRTRLLHEVDQQRNPKTRATVIQLLDRYLETLDVEPTTRTLYEGIIRIYLRPALGRLPLSKLDGDLLDRLFVQLRRDGSAATTARSTSSTESSASTSATSTARPSPAGRCRHRPYARPTGCSTLPSPEPC